MPRPPNPNPFKVDCAGAMTPMQRADGTIIILYISNDPDEGIGWWMRKIENPESEDIKVSECRVSVDQVCKLALLWQETHILEVTQTVARAVLDEWPSAAKELAEQVAAREKPYAD